VSNNLNGNNPDTLIQGCINKDRQSQKLLYKQFYGYGMSICMRYTRNRNEAMEVLNDSFMKVFLRINQFDNKHLFKSWFRKIVINSSIDYIKKEIRNRQNLSIDGLINIAEENQGSEITQEELLNLVQRLSPAYRSVFNLYVIDGYNHQEISKMLEISVGTSKSNLSKARLRLREFLLKMDKEEYARFAG
jgi:RNA polymerase sigma factor (sigma-70 family)